MNEYKLGSQDFIRFWSNVETGDMDACWPWRGGTNGNGYGSFSLKGRPIIASRIAYQLAYGAIPDGLVVRHSCDNPPCCNGRHLLTGTTQDNTKDRQRRGRHAHGRGVWTVQLTADDVMRIRHSPRSEWKAIAKELGRPFVTVYSAAIGRSWKHLPDVVPTDAHRHRGPRK